MRILGISGSLRAASFNTAALRAAESLLPAGVAMSIQTLHGIPVYDADVQAQGFPEAVDVLGAGIREADAVLICSPEYNFSVPGGLKNALDWLSRLPYKPMERKPVAIMGASTGRLGTARGQYHLRQVLHALDTRVISRPEVMISSAKDAIGEDDSFVDPRTAEIVGRLLQSLCDLAGPGLELNA